MALNRGTVIGSKRLSKAGLISDENDDLGGEGGITSASLISSISRMPASSSGSDTIRGRQTETVALLE